MRISHRVSQRHKSFTSPCKLKPCKCIRQKLLGVIKQSATADLSHWMPVLATIRRQYCVDGAQRAYVQTSWRQLQTITRRNGCWDKQCRLFCRRIEHSIDRCRARHSPWYSVARCLFVRFRVVLCQCFFGRNATGTPSGLFWLFLFFYNLFVKTLLPVLSIHACERLFRSCSSVNWFKISRGFEPEWIHLW